MDQTTPPVNRLSPWVQALIAAALLAMFAGVLFLPAFVPNFKPESAILQTLFTLVTAVVFFFIGKNTDSANREAALTAAAIQSVPVAALPPVTGVKIDDSVPINVKETP